jgi:putative metallohydrolase (TIGR04338 family)
MARERDTQRSRLYAAEQAAAKSMGMSSRTRTIANDDLQAWVDKMMGSKPIATRWRQPIRVVLKRGGSAYGGHGAISLPLFARNEWVILHEIAHCLNPGLGRAPHGREFAGILVFLVDTVIGKDAGEALRREFREANVDWTSLSVPEPRYEWVSPSAKARRTSELRRAATQRPLRADERRHAAEAIRRAVKSGLYGPSGSKPRTHALATARRLERGGVN